ncbi:MAG: LysR family transcriptional regulator [Hyphomicrobiales bacterium]
MKLDPRHLAQLSTIVETGSFQSAADRLGLSQPALSRNMSVLESRLKTPVFRRSGRKAVPTELGRRLARAGLSIRVAEENAGTVADLAASGSVGELRLGAPPIVAGRFLTDVLSDFIKIYPECHVELRVGIVYELRSMLERGQIDLIVGPQSLAEAVSELVFTTVVEDSVGIICRSDHPLMQRGQISPELLSQQVWVAHSRGSTLRQQTESALVAMGLKDIKIGFETDSIGSVLEIVGTTDLISTMPRLSTRPYLQDKLSFLDIDHVQFRRPIGLIRRKDTTEHLVQKQFSKALMNRYQ